MEANRHARWLTTAVALSLLAGLCSPVLAADTKPPEADTKQSGFESADAKVRLKYPANWKKNETPPNGVTLHLVPNESADSGTLGAVLLLLTPAKMPGNKPVDLKGAAAGFIRGQKDQDPTAKVIDQAETTVAGSPALRLTMLLTINGSAVNVRFFLVFRADKMYMLQGMAEPAVFEAVGVEVDAMAASIEWL